MIDDAVIAVVVPAFEEQARIGEVLASMPAYVDRVVVVDDASRDATADRAASFDRVEVIRHQRNRGVGAAIASGYRRALERGADVVAVMAGDGQMDPADLRRLLELVLRGEADYAKGNRLAHPEVWRAMPRARLFGSLVLSRLTSWAAGVPIADSQCGYTAIAAHALRRVDVESLYPRYGYPNDLIGLLAIGRQRIVEVPVRPVYRGEASGMRPWHVLVIGALVGRVAWRRLRHAVVDRRTRRRIR
jgi:glycosyltransferase involved in cell wall biosynthesis